MDDQADDPFFSGGSPWQRAEDDDQPLDFLDPSTLAGKPVPPRRWIVQDWIPWLTVTGLYGDGGVGKSLLAQQLLTSTAIGKPWLGLPVVLVRSIGVFCEDPIEELHRRQADINQFYGCNFTDLEAIRWLPRFGENNILMTGGGEPTDFFDQLRQEAIEFKARLIVIDTVADTFGGNENDRGQVRQYVQACLGRLARDIDGCVMALAHPSRTGMNSGRGDSGSTGWSNSFRSRAVLELPEVAKGATPDPYARMLSRKKANYALREDQLRLRWQNGVLLPENCTADVSRATPRRPPEAVFLDLLDILTNENRPVSDNNHAPNYAPRLFANRPEYEPYDKKSFERAMEKLFSAGEIRIQEYGRSSDLRRRIVRSQPSSQAAEAAE